jgi:hypothetical protein
MLERKHRTHDNGFQQQLLACPQGTVVAQLQTELQSCRDQLGAQFQAVAAMTAERDAARASASDSADRAKVRA